MSTKQEYIAEADRFLVQAGVPTYSDLLAALKVARSAMENIGVDEDRLFMQDDFYKPAAIVDAVLTTAGAA